MNDSDKWGDRLVMFCIAAAVLCYAMGWIA